MKLKHLLLLFLLCLHLTIQSQKQAYIQYTSKDGLPANNIYMGFQDSKGYMWFGTDAGLSRFDGYTFKNFGIQDGLPDTDIFDILEDKKGRIWFATYNGKLGYLYNDKFYNSSNSEILKGHDFNSYISCMHEDTKGNIWFGTRINGLKYLDSDGKFHKISKNEMLNTKNRLYTYSIWENNKGEIFTLTNNAIENLTKKESIPLKNIGITLGKKDSRHYKTRLLDNGELILTENSRFYILDKDYKTIVKKTSFESLDTTVLFLDNDTSENIWAGTYNGIFKLDLKKEKYITDIDFLKGLTISSRKKDKQGNLWFTTLEKGIYFLPSIEVMNYTVNDVLPEEEVNAIDGNNKGEIIIGQEAYYSIIKDGKLSHFNDDPYSKIKRINSFPKHIYNVSLENNGDYIVSSVDGAIVNRKEQKSYYAHPTRIAINYKKDSLIIGFSKVVKAKIAELEFLSKQDFFPLKTSSSSVINSIYWDEQDNSIWVGLINGVLQIKNNIVIDHSNRHAILKSHITAIKPSNKKDFLWISTSGKGVVLLNKNGNPELTLTEENGLSSNICKTLTEDENGKLWIATNNGLNKLVDLENKNITKYSASDGLLSNNINDVFVHKNKVWIATPQGLSMMDLSDEKNYTIPIYITKTTVNGIPKNINNNYNLLHDENNININFVALNYSMGGEVLYRYKIKENQNWKYTYNNSIEFSSLKDGNYTFIIEAKNKQGIWRKESATLNFKIAKPWWLTWWAFLLYFISFSSFIFGLFKYESKKRQLKIQLLLEKKESLKFKELDQFKSQFFTNISHEIKTPLTLINGYISDLKFKSSNNIGTKQNLEKQVHKITSLIDSVLDLAKMQSSNFNLHLNVINLSELIRKLSINFKPIFDQKNIALNTIGNANDYFSNIDVLHLEKAINNLIINALKYTSTGEVTIAINELNDKIILKISDTGIGIPTDELENVFNRFYQVNNDINNTGGSGIGLAFCKEIVELHQGEISLKSKLNIGSEFSITLPLIKTQPTITSTRETIIKKETEEINTNNTSLLNHNFLIVDDNYDMRKYLVSILKKYNCFEAKDGLEALKIINENKIDFIITDYMMPKLNGYELVIKLNEINNSTPIIMLTAKTDIDTKLDVLKLGIDDYITKPFNKNELLTRISNCLKNYTSKENYNKENNIKEEITHENPFIKKLKNYILNNSNNTALHQDVIAKEFNISKSSFYRKIKSNTGLSPNNFIKEIRLQKAREIIQNDTDISLKELSFLVGFNHTSYFSKIYEKRFGVKPLSHK